MQPQRITSIIVHATAVLAGLAVPGVAHSQCPFSFESAVAYDAGDGIGRLVVSDLNGDGWPDVAGALLGDHDLSILMNSGDGAFAAPELHAGEGLAIDVAGGDFNGDGRLDLATANFSSNNISVYLNQGGGLFGAPVHFGTGGDPSAIVSGDFNGDGFVDLATSSSSGNNVAVLLSNGDGTFANHVNYAAGSVPYHLAVGDLNADGSLDLVVANALDADVSALLGNGDGTFGGRVDTSVGGFPSAVAIGDLDGDGRHDVAVAIATELKVAVLSGNGDGTFAVSDEYEVGPDPILMTIGDVTGDGHLDIAVANSGDGTISLLEGNGDGTFDSAIELAVGGTPTGVFIADMNGDGRHDLLAGNLGGYVSVLYNESQSMNIIQQPQSRMVSAGEDATLEVLADGVAHYQWRRQGEPLQEDGHFLGVMSDTLTITNAVPEDFGVYEVYMVAACGVGVTSQPVALSVTCAEAATVLSAESCLLHGEGGPNEAQWCIDLAATNGIEPRAVGRAELRFKVSSELNASTVRAEAVHMACVNQTPSNVDAWLDDADTVVVAFDLADAIAEDCCRVGFSGVLTNAGGSVEGRPAISLLRGDTDFSGNITGGDASRVKPLIGRFVGDIWATPEFDVDRDGEITLSDSDLIRANLGQAANRCD